MQKAEFVELLNGNGNNFKMDIENANNGYPVLNEKETVKIIFEDEILYNKVVEKLLHKIENYYDDTMTIEMTQENIDTVTILELNNYTLGSTEKIQNIRGIKNFTNLIKLKLSYNSIRDISELQYLTKLEYLDLGENNISNIDAISQLSELKTLYLNYNDIETVPILNCSNLTYLDLRTNKLTDINKLSSLSNLEELYLYNYTHAGVETDKANAIGDISPLEELQYLTKLDARNQKLEQTGFVKEEINLPLIFIQAKDEQSIAYTESDFILRNCTLNSDATKIIVGENTTQNASITISGGALSGSTFTITVTEKLEIYLGTYEEQQEETGKYITKIAPETTIEEILENIDTNGTIEIYKGTQKITDTETNIGTGMTVKISFNNQEQEYTVVVKGDINGDGNAKLSDLSKLKLSVIGTTQLEGAYKEAADLNGDGNVKLSDLSKMKLYLVGTGSL